MRQRVLPPNRRTTRPHAPMSRTMVFQRKTRAINTLLPRRPSERPCYAQRQHAETRPRNEET
eukprot:11136826-Lingulodinium_polyedra.AAC.1